MAKSKTVGAFLVALMVLGMGTETTVFSGQKDRGDILAIMGNKVMTRADLEARLSALPAQYQKRFRDQKGKKEFVERLVQIYLFAMEARAVNIDQDKAVAARIEDAVNSILAQEYIKRKLSDRTKISEQDIEKYYQEHKREFTKPAMVKARHILVKVDPRAKPEDVSAARARAQEIGKELDEGADFAKLARQYSDDTKTKNKGGDLGLFPRERMTPPFSRAAFALKKGEISRPVRTHFGFHIIKVEDKRAQEQMDLDRVKARIRSKLAGMRKNAGMAKEIERLKKKYKVRINIQAAE